MSMMFQTCLRGAITVGVVTVFSILSGQSADGPNAEPVGLELFVRKWIPNDTRAHGGDGLGPMFNESSCVACHNLGGIGGGGASDKNIDLINLASLTTRSPAIAVPFGKTPTAQLDQKPVTSLVINAVAQTIQSSLVSSSRFQLARLLTTRQPPSEETIKARKELASQKQLEFHPDFAKSKTVVLHRFGTDSHYREWRSERVDDKVGPRRVGGSSFRFGANTRNTLGNRPDVQRLRIESQVQTAGLALVSTLFADGSQLIRSQRNATALFGAGRIDQVPEDALREIAQTQQAENPDQAGRPSKLSDGRLGRFGWKSQTASLEDFTLTACAVELGLNVPDHEQASSTFKPDYKAPGLDLNRDECNALVQYLRELPTPVQRVATSSQETSEVKAGHSKFTAIGCAVCQVQKLASVDGLYSDLLLHDMGQELGDSGSYGIPFSDDQDSDVVSVQLANATPVSPFATAQQTPEQTAKLKGALRQEWRTPPLWGVRDSAPYLHDGRARTLEHAIAFHGGQGAKSALAFFESTPGEKNQVIAFLKSLTAPIGSRTWPELPAQAK